MCGIAGIVSRTRGEDERGEIVRRMTASLAHRGPDGMGLASVGPCTIGLCRLAIMDPAAEARPFGSEDRSILSVANGEIYNAAELRDGLADRGHRFATGVDTELLPHLYEEDGPDLVERLQGMFAIALWDQRRERLLLARDRAGEKPLFYRAGRRDLLFASELRALGEHLRFEVDAVALRRYLLHGHFPDPHSPFAGVRKLPPGHLLVGGRDTVTIRRYWDLAEHFDDPELARRGPEDLAQELDSRIARAVTRRRRSDVPVGVFLSGGIDSTTLLAHLAEQIGPGVPAFTLGHSDREFDETSFARETGRYFDADLHTLVLGEVDLAEGLRRVAAGFDEPLGDSSSLPTHLLALFARQHVRVVLSGEGADELFAGYPTYIGHRIARTFARVPRLLRRATAAFARAVPVGMGNVDPAYLLREFADAAEQEAVERHLRWFGSLSADTETRVMAERVQTHWDADDRLGAARDRLARRAWPDDLSRILYLDFTTYLAAGLLTKIDRATMLASLEARAPFLDRELMEFAAGLPSRCKLHGLKTKALLRRAVRHRVPPAVLTRRKRGFNIPFSRWLLDGLGDELRRRFSPERVAARGLFDASGLQRLLEEHLRREADHRRPLFTLLALDLWCDRTFGDGARVPIASSRPEASLRAETVAS